MWIFFTGAVFAATARAVGTVLLREAMVLRGSMDLRSYDRLFPNQDVLPEGGFGNLIAAPLQGRRRKDGLTTFLDLGTLEPYADQWAFLSTLDRLSPGDADHVARQAKQAVTGADIATMNRSAATQVHPPLPPVVHAQAGAGLSIDARQLTPAALGGRLPRTRRDPQQRDVAVGPFHEPPRSPGPQIEHQMTAYRTIRVPQIESKGPRRSEMRRL
ncbi:hypothetical protein QQG74_03095 [Micromonospora sp. FIMYZ51]|uniref:TOTE conflict system archaeo-eukaryotic primase domain-containing protein n=1 Tax=Micromonospora sp. FIMYZ51 TaxID=3051832 RepID=UPI00311E267B